MKSKLFFEVIPIKKLRCDPSGIKVMDDEEYQRLKKSIQESGILSPIQVTYVEEEDVYQILDGRHRYKAALELGLEFVPCVVETTKTPEIITSHIYDSELIRKMYTPEEVTKFLKEKVQQTNLLKERLISTLASEMLPKEILEKAVNSDLVNSAHKMQKLIQYMSEYNKQLILEMRKEIDEYKNQLLQKEIEETRLKEELKAKENALKELEAKFDTEVQRKSQELLKKELEKIKAISPNTPTEQQIENIRREIKEAVYKELQAKFDKYREELEKEVQDTKQKLVDLSHKYRSTKEQHDQKEEEIKNLKEQVKFLEKMNKILQEQQAYTNEKLRKITTYRTIQQKIDYLHQDIHTIRNLIVYYSAIGYEEEELADLKGRLKKVQELLEVIVQEVDQIKPVTYYLERNS